MAAKLSAEDEARLRRLRLLERSPLIDALSAFLRALDGVYQEWRSTSATKMSGSPELRRHYGDLVAAREVAKPLVGSSLVPPPGQTADEFASGILHCIEQAWRACLFLHVVHPNDQSPEKQIELRDLRALPELHSFLGKAVTHLIHVESLKNKRQKAARKPSGSTVARAEHEARKLVAERYERFKREYQSHGYSRDSYVNFAAWASESFDDMPSDDHVELKRMRDAYRKTPNPLELR